MKRLIILFFFISFFIFKGSYSEDVFVEKVDISLKENEIGITFFSFKNSHSLLIKTNNIKTFLVLDDPYSIEKNFVKMFDFFNVDYLVMDRNFDFFVNYENRIYNSDFSYSHINYIFINGIVKLNYGENNLCVISSKTDKNTLENCDFIYFYSNFSDYIDILENTKIVFYNKSSLNSNVLKDLYSKWIDSYLIRDYDFVTLKLDFKNYTTITIPIIHR